MIETPIETVAAQAAPRCLDTLTRAFREDPVARWIFPDPQLYAQWFPRLARAFVEPACGERSAQQVGDFGGTAVWLRPGSDPDEATLEAVARLGVEPGRRAGVFQLLEQMADRHPTEPHWYLPLLGVDPSRQGLGLGSALLAEATRTCDRLGSPAYLEATSAANAALYRRHGFDSLEPIRIDGAPPLTPMWREPRAIRQAA